MSSVVVKWRATDEDDADFFGGTEEQTTILAGLWAEVEENAQDAVNKICEDYFDDEIWTEFFGDDAWAGVRVRVTEPSAIAGTYLVDLSRKTVAHSRKIEDAAIVTEASSR